MDELPIQSGDDVVRVRQHVRNAAAANGLSLVDQTKLVTAASELARNPPPGAPGSSWPLSMRGQASPTSTWR
jgi:hypothetical protein